MKKISLICVLAILFTFKVQGQSIEKVKDKLIAKIKEKIIDHSWTLEVSRDLIELQYIDTFFINSTLGPLNNTRGWHNKQDTLYITIKLVENWSQEKYNSIKREQEKVLAPLIEKYMDYYDSLNWKNIKSNKDIFLTRPVFYLNYWDGLSKDEKSALQTIVRLPDNLIKGIGIFIDVTYNPCGSYIEPRSVFDKVETSYQLLSEIFGISSLYKCEPLYK